MLSFISKIANGMRLTAQGCTARALSRNGVLKFPKIEGESVNNNMKLSYCLYDPPGDTEQNLPPIILLHGMMDSKMTWYKLGPMIAQHTGRKVYAVDARNHGDSGWSNDFNFDILADDLKNFIEERGIRKASVIGHSMGGKTSMTLALKHPELVEKLVVEDISPRNFNVKAGAMIAMLAQALKEGISEVPKGVDVVTAAKKISSFVLQLIPKELLPSGDNVLLFHPNNFPIKKLEDGSYAWKTNLDAIIEALTSETQLKQNMSGVYMGDVLFLYGTKSLFRVQRDEYLVKKYFPRAEMKGVEGADHLIHHKRPNEFLSEVVTFINGTPTNLTLTKSKY